MQRWHGLDSVPAGWGHCVVTIGVFDGIHRGHQSIIAEAVRMAGERGVPSVLITFVPHPSEVVRPGSHPPVLTSIVRRAELVEQLGVDVFCALPFTLEFSQMAPDEFVHHALVDRLHASAVVVGENFRFGHKAAGDVACSAASAARSASPRTAPPLLAEGDTTAQRHLRPLLRQRRRHGDGGAGAGPSAPGRRRRRARRPARARTRLPDREPAHRRVGGGPGRRRLRRPGRAPRRVGPHRRRPPLGRAAISVGTNPTFEVRQRRVEAYVLDFGGDLYGATLGIEFVERLRGMEKFDRVDALVSRWTPTSQTGPCRTGNEVRR